MAVKIVTLKTNITSGSIETIDLYHTSITFDNLLFSDIDIKQTNTFFSFENTAKASVFYAVGKSADCNTIVPIEVLKGPVFTPSVTPTVTPSVTLSTTPTISVSVTPSITPTISETPSITVTPSETPSITVTPSETVTPTPSVTPTVTPTATTTPSITVSPSPSPSTIWYTYTVDATPCGNPIYGTQNIRVSQPLTIGDVIKTSLLPAVCFTVTGTATTGQLVTINSISADCATCI